jgi:membrane-bound lytic murein transglycosylase A
MKRAIHGSLLLTSLLAACKTSPDYTRLLPEGAPALIPLGPDDELPDLASQWAERDEILPALELSLAWTRKDSSQRFFPQAGVTHERALRSLERLHELLVTESDAESFQRAIQGEFTIYKSAGWNGSGGGVLFTAYCTPILRGSLEQDELHRFPLYALPPDLRKNRDGSVAGWETAAGAMPSYPSRHAIEAGHLLAGKDLELVWLADPIDAYIAHVNGSAFVELADGSMVRVGYAGKNGRPYTSLGKELERDGRVPKGKASLRSIREWAAKASPAEVDEYLSRNESYVFFTPIEGNPHGSLDVEVTAERSLATDKALFPRGAIVFVAGQVPPASGEPPAPFQELMFDQDSGGAIRTAGRADIYLGIGPEAEGRAGSTKSEGQLYYLFLKE